ncbi:protein-N(5)-glutamine methyltransferase prmC [Vibrio ishigakensis]|uniref:Release factor glutamine methyltransferase n=1 Tax=Vibrio ishigakensis TaxID=1481914 RepID=A0A0B8NPW5_9VIBR|nr:protein-N(5)-glutamine methyltransferase prmC [Vibrio ishigakensis]
MPTIEQAQRQASLRFADLGIDSARIDAEVLLCHVLGKSRTYLFTWSDKHLTEQEQSAFEQVVSRREQGEPVAYIVGVREFWSLPLKVSTSTLIPRPDTERLVELALEKMGIGKGKGLDLGTGTGAIALALASERDDYQMLGVDLQPEAQQLATENADVLNIANATFLHGSWFEPIAEGEKFDIIVSNPPYIDETDPHLSQGDVRFEPDSALVADENGLADLAISPIKRENIYNQRLGFLWSMAMTKVKRLARYCSALVTTRYQQQDYAGVDRVTMGQFKG